MLALPIDYFERRPVGEIMHDMNEFHKIRTFLAGQMFGTLLDAVVLFVFIPIMFFFSALLTFFVLGICVLICTWISDAVAGFAAGKSGAVMHDGKPQGVPFLVETSIGIRTVNVDGARRAAASRMGCSGRRSGAPTVCRGSRFATMVQTVVHPLERLMTTGVFALAAYLAISTKEPVYIGALVAFMMLSARVAQPLIQLAQMITQYDEVRLARFGLSATSVNQAARRGSIGIRRALAGPRAGRIRGCPLPLSGSDDPGARPRVVRGSRGDRVRHHGT